jgi:TolB-like protein/tetratricopeptide (TPR) repeat protein
MIDSAKSPEGSFKTPMENTPCTPSPLRFGLFEVDFRSGELRKQGVRIRLQEQPLQILAMLLKHPGQVVTREELRTRLWPADTFVDFDHGLNKAMNKLREALGDSADSPRFIETLARRGYRFMESPAARPGRIESLAVLPLKNLSGDPEQEYFADGMTEALINSLAKIGALRVISRTSAMRYKQTEKSLPQIAQELNVDAVVEGTVQRSAERVCICAQLIQASTDTHLWAERYERDMRDVLALQSEVAQAIGREVRVKLTPHDQAHFADVHSVVPVAYEAYLKGRYHWSRRSREGFGRAVDYFQQAIAKDSAYAGAYTGLADALSIMGLWGLVPPEDGCGRAKRLAAQALELDDSLAEAHTSLAWAASHYDYDFLAAERGFERSLELNPRYATGHLWFGMTLALMGRYEEAYTELQRAIRLDPDWSNTHFGLEFVYWAGRRYDRAIERGKKALELDPHSVQARTFLGMSCTANSMYELAISTLREAVELSNSAPVPVASLAEAYAAAGSVDETHKLLQELLKPPHVTSYFVARIYAALGQKDEALRRLETGYRERTEWLGMLKVDARLDGLRSDPRFQDLMMRMNFPP